MTPRPQAGRPPIAAEAWVRRSVRSWREAGLTAWRGTVSIWIALAVLCLVIGVLRPEFWHPADLANLVRQSSVLGLVALGQTVVILAGGIDLSVSGAVKLTALLGAGLMAGVLGNVPIALAVMVSVALVIGFVNGMIVGGFGASPFIVTLGTLLVLQGISFTYAPSSIGRVPEQVVQLYDVRLGPLPLPGVVLAVAYVVGWVSLRHSVWGRNVYAVGGSAEASRLAGIGVGRTRISTYALAALLSALGGLILLARSGVGDSQMGDGLELNSIAAVVLGGTSLFGGRGGIVGTLGGVLFLSVIATALNLLQIPSYYQVLVSGLVIVAAVAARRQA